MHNIAIPNTIEIISEGLFSGCAGLTALVVPESISKIETNAFAGCIKLHELDIPESVTAIGDGAFSGCVTLIKITILPTVTQIGTDAFKNCPALTIYGEAGSYAENYANTNLIPFIAFGAPIRNPDDYSYRLTADGTGIVVTGYKGKDTKIEIPGSFEGKPVV